LRTHLRTIDIAVSRSLRSSAQYADNPKAVLEAWVFAHFDAPYPNDHDKNLLASLTSMPRAQACCHVRRGPLVPAM
jgi:hypothetical protein